MKVQILILLFLWLTEKHSNIIEAYQVYFSHPLPSLAFLWQMGKMKAYHKLVFPTWNMTLSGGCGSKLRLCEKKSPFLLQSWKFHCENLNTVGLLKCVAVTEKKKLNQTKLSTVDWSPHRPDLNTIDCVSELDGKKRRAATYFGRLNAMFFLMLKKKLRT